MLNPTTDPNSVPGARSVEWSLDGQRFGAICPSSFDVLIAYLVKRWPDATRHLVAEVRAGRVGSLRLDADCEVYLRLAPPAARQLTA